ncbi:hypothetical protein jhhlp_001139 [Lomentospora prolificans]|uniref:Nuclear pore complex protein n=1 Tax=Lomentospora prolificans TaxID=41688 RepID=A0A2N3NHC8_9PEZI|nr:hypothetical protein jhhlp_001139 [Lomentospora prolificans]
MGSRYTSSRQTKQALAVGAEVEYFANALDDCLDDRGSIAEKRARVFKLVDIYHTYAREQHERLRSRTGPLSATSMPEKEGAIDMDADSHDSGATSLEYAQEENYWDQEAQIWNLLRHLLPTRYCDTDTFSSKSRSGRLQKPTLWNEFLDNNPLAMERKAVLRWLQSISKDGPDINEVVKDLQKSADRGDIIAHGWIHTRSTIKLRKSVLAWPHVLDPSSPEVSQSHVNSSKSPLVTQLDPDSITRQERRLEPQDEYFERAIWLGCFELLRRGYSAGEIEKWCRERTEGWRSVSMSAIHMSDSEALSSPDFPPESFALWTRSCLAVARQGALGDYERAVHGILSGDVSSVENICKTWEDYLFAHYNALFRSQFDAFILGRCSPEAVATLSSFCSSDMIQHYDESSSPEKRVLRLLESRDVTKAAARNPMKVLEAAILSKELERHFFDQGLALALSADKDHNSEFVATGGLSNSDIDTGRFFQLDHYHGLRVASHVYIILSRLENLFLRPHEIVSVDITKRDIQQNIVVGYTSLLRLSGLYELIPLYCSTLSESRQYDALCHNLIHIVDPASRELAVSLIEKAGLDSLKFVKTQAALQFSTLLIDKATQSPFRIVENAEHSLKYGRPVRPDFFGEDPDAIDPTHELLIRAIEWLLVVDHAWPEALSTGTKVYKVFLKNMYLNSARTFAQRINFSAILSYQAENTGDDHEGSPDLADITFWAQKLSSLPAFSGSPAQVAADARNFRELEALVRALDTMETLASLEQLAKEDSNISRDFWTRVGAEIKTLKEHMQPLFGGWLLSGIQEGDSELASLRTNYLPETILAYVSTLHFAGTCLSRDNLLESMELSTIIADKDSDIAACFIQTRRMKELVESFASSSKALAVMTGDKKVAGSTSKKMRETGWTRNLWSVKSTLGGEGHTSVDIAKYVMELPPPTIPPKPGVVNFDGNSEGPPTPLPTQAFPPPAPSSHDGGSQRHHTDPGASWIPPTLQDMPKEDLAAILRDGRLLRTATNAPETAHPSLRASYEALQSALVQNSELASKLLELELRVSNERSAAQAQLLSTHALERQWRQKQSDLDGVLAPFSPTSLYQRLCQGVQEQAMICLALEDSFIDGGTGESVASEREVIEWTRRYREAKTLFYLRQERKERWDEGRVGGWR